MSTGLSWKMKNRPGSWRKHLPAPSPSLIQAYSPGRDRPIFPFNDLPYDIQESVLRYLPVVDLIRSRAVSATFIIVYEGVVCTEFASLAGVPKPKFSSIANEFQFLYRCRHLTHPVHVTPLLLWAAARDQHVMIKRILQKALGKRISRLVTEFDEDTSFNKDDCTGSFENDMNDVMTMEMLRGANGITPLHVSCRNDHVKSTMELIKAGGDVLARDQKLQTPFYHACALGQGPAINILRTIIKHCHFLRNVVRAHKERESYDPEVEPEKKIRDIDLNMVSSEGKTCLYAAAERGHPGVVRTLLISGGHTSAKENAPTEDLELPILGVLDLEKGTKEGTPLGVACAGGKIKTVTLLLEAGANVNGCDPRGEWQTPLFLASENGKPDIIELLLDRCPPASSSAARHDGDRRTFAPPTDQIHCDLDFASKTGKTPLFIACEKGKAQCAKLLVEAGANVSKPTFLIKTPLYIACEMGHTAIVQILLKYSTRSDVVMETNYGTTAAFIAQRNGFMKIKMQLTEFMVSTQKESAQISFTRVQKERQKSYMIKLTKKYNSLELKQKETKAKLNIVQNYQYHVGGTGTAEELNKELGETEKKLKTAKEQLDRARSMSKGEIGGGGGGGGGHGRSKDDGGKRGRTKNKDQSKNSKSSMQRKRRGSAYGTTSTSRQRNTSRPHSRPALPKDSTRRDKRGVDEETEGDEASILQKKEKQSRNGVGPPPKRSKSSTVISRPTLENRHGWHGEGSDDEDAPYSGSDDIEVLAESEQSRTTGWDVPSDVSQEMVTNNKDNNRGGDDATDMNNDGGDDNEVIPNAPTSPDPVSPIPFIPKQKSINNRYKNQSDGEDDNEDVEYSDDDFEVEEKATPKMEHQEKEKEKEKKKPQNMFEKKRTSHVTTATTKAFQNKTPKEKKTTRGARPQMGADRWKKKNNSSKMKLSDMSMQRSQQVYGKMYGKAYQAPPSNSEQRARSGRPQVPIIQPSKSLSHGGGVQLPPPESPSRTQAKSPRGGWHRSHQNSNNNNNNSNNNSRGKKAAAAATAASAAKVAIKKTKQPLLDPAVAALLRQSNPTENGGVQDQGKKKITNTPIANNGNPVSAELILTHGVFQCLQGRSLSSIHRCLLRFSRSTSGFLISPSLLAYVFGASTSDVDAVFEKFDTELNSDGIKRKEEKELETENVDAFECFVATTMLASASLEDRLRFCFGLFDREGTNRLSRRHVGMLIRCCITSVAKLHYDPVKAGSLSDLTSGSSISKMVEEVFSIKSSSNPKRSKGGSETVSAKQFAKWARGYQGGLPCPFVVVLLDLQNNIANLNF